LRILLLAPGISIHSQRFLQMLLDAGYRVTLVDTDNPKPEGAERYIFIPYPHIGRLQRSRLRGAYRLGNWLKLIQLRRIWKRVEPDIVHVHWVDARAFDCAQAGLHPLVLTCWGSDINNLFENGGERDQNHRHRIASALSAADHVTADSREVLERCEKLAGKKLSTSLFYFGIDLNKFKPGLDVKVSMLREKLRIPHSAKVVLSARRLERMMGHHHILTAFAKAIEDAKLDAVLLFHRYLSPTKDYENELKELARELSVSERIIWLDDTSNEQMPILYGLADVVVNFPERDGLPVSLFEAAACQRPIITSNLPAYRDLINEGAFTVVPPNDVQSLQDALIIALQHPSDQLATQLAINRRLIERVADERNCFRKIEQIYERLLSPSTPVPQT